MQVAQLLVSVMFEFATHRDLSFIIEICSGVDQSTLVFLIRNF